MNTLEFFSTLSKISWRKQRNELPLKVFLTTFAIRTVFQVIFFTWVTQIIGGPESMKFALYGNIFLPAMSFLFVDTYNVLKEESDTYSLELMICSERSLLMIVIGRTVGYILRAFFVILFTYVTIMIFLPSAAHWFLLIKALPLVLILVCSVYSVAVLIAVIKMKSTLSYMMPNLMVFLLMLLGDVTVPLAKLPHFLQYVSNILPMRHAVSAFRAYMIDQVPYWTNRDFYLEIVIGLVYACIGYTLFLRSVKTSRKHPIMN